MGKFRNHTTKTNIMKKQNQFVQAIKCCLTNGKFALLLFSSIILFTSCGNGLSRSKAEKIIKDFYGFPIVETYGFPLPRLVSQEENLKRKKMIDENLMVAESRSNGWFTENEKYYFTEKTNNFIVSRDEYSLTHSHTVVSNCLVFNEITGIIVNEQNKSATVSWTCKRIGITPFGEYAGYKENDVVNHSSIFILYDDGWRINDKKNEKVKNLKDYPFFNDKGEYIGIK
jgi:hypothetical protein